MNVNSVAVLTSALILATTPCVQAQTSSECAGVVLHASAVRKQPNSVSFRVTIANGAASPICIEKRDLGGELVIQASANRNVWEDLIATGAVVSGVPDGGVRGASP